MKTEKKNAIHQMGHSGLDGGREEGGRCWLPACLPDNDGNDNVVLSDFMIRKHTPQQRKRLRREGGRKKERALALAVETAR